MDEKTSKRYSIIVAGGSGARMEASMPKQFMMILEKPVLLYSINAFYQFDQSMEIIVVLHPAYYSWWAEYCNKQGIDIPHTCVRGGESRCHSVQNGLKLVKEPGYVAIHDAARPLVSYDLIKSAFEQASLFGNAIPAVSVMDTIRTTGEGRARLMDRKLLKAIQTPQVFEAGLIKRAYEQPFEERFTDDASLVEALGIKLNLIEGEPTNLKLTLPVDLLIAETILKATV